MKKYFDQLRPSERRLVVAVLVILFLVLNWVYVVPHFSDLAKLRLRTDAAESKLKRFNNALAEKPELEKQVKQFESEGQFVELEDQGIKFLRDIQAQAGASGVAMVNPSRPIVHTNDVFFVEQVQNINVLSTDDKLVKFLYDLGSSASMIRVRDLDLQPDPPRQQLDAKIRLVANYQKNPPAAAGKNSTAKAK